MKHRKKMPDKLLTLLESHKSSHQSRVSTTPETMMNIFPRLEVVVEMIYMVENAVKTAKKLFFRSVQRPRDKQSGLEEPVETEADQQIETENMQSLSRFGLILWELLVRNVENYLRDSIDL